MRLTVPVDQNKMTEHLDKHRKGSRFTSMEVCIRCIKANKGDSNSCAINFRYNRRSNLYFWSPNCGKWTFKKGSWGPSQECGYGLEHIVCKRLFIFPNNRDEHAIEMMMLEGEALLQKQSTSAFELQFIDKVLQTHDRLSHDAHKFLVSMARYTTEGSEKVKGMIASLEKEMTPENVDMVVKMVKLANLERLSAMVERVKRVKWDNKRSKDDGTGTTG